jgi:hypothetical protein
VNCSFTEAGSTLPRYSCLRKQVILTSGVELSADVAATLCEAGPMLKKPYPPQDVVDRIKQLAARVGRSDRGKR